MKRVTCISWLMMVVFFSPPGAGPRAAVTHDEDEVIFTIEYPGAERIYLVGDFNGWNPTRDKMDRTGDIFEIRLYPVPGRYRYMFIVDGATVADPDNLHRDSEGMSFFIFREKGDDWEIVFDLVTETEEPGEVSSARFSGLVAGCATEEKSSLFLDNRLAAAIDDRIDAGLAIGFEHQSEGKVDGRAYLLQGTATYQAARGTIRAFHREGKLDQGDPLAIFGAVGPFGYPLGIFCRGAKIEGKGPGATRGMIVYASRISGYGTGLQGARDQSDSLLATVDPSALPFLERTLEDSDLIGIRAGGAFGRWEVDLLYRYDLRPGGRRWILPQESQYRYSGYEKARIQGAWSRFSWREDLTLQAEYLSGSTKLVSRMKTFISTADEEPCPEREYDWESGSRICLGGSYRLNRMGIELLWKRTSISGDPDLRRGPGNSTHQGIDIKIELERDRFSGALILRDESYPDIGTGELFWLQRNNFWLDGDEITFGRLPYLDSGGFHEIKLYLGENGSDSIPHPCSTAGFLSLLVRVDKYDAGRRMGEIGLRKGVYLGGGVFSQLDLRGVSYGGNPDLGNPYLDIYLALGARLSDRAWCQLGTGVCPFIYDRYRRRYVSTGRESYLLERSLLEDRGLEDRGDLYRRMKAAERDLADDWSISFNLEWIF
ncbi:MAG: glycogen-binding domain-containing protein [Candidatus Krumholzibacteriota bacterium]|nr:glycogen-binding domain-containing protein [Candidatus Krumholzibacteriota bacterium]